MDISQNQGQRRFQEFFPCGVMRRDALEGQETEVGQGRWEPYIRNLLQVDQFGLIARKKFDGNNAGVSLPFEA